MVFRKRDEIADHDERETVQDRSWDFAPGQIVSLIVGALAIILGLLALIRAGLDSPLGVPVVDVAGLSHTAWLGLGEVGLGLLLVLAGATPRSRSASVVLGVAILIAGVLVVAETDGMPQELALEQNYGWVLAISGAVVALAAMTLPTIHRAAVRSAGDGRFRDRDVTQHA